MKQLKTFEMFDVRKLPVYATAMWNPANELPQESIRRRFTYNFNLLHIDSFILKRVLLFFLKCDSLVIL
jgi:hypothetical protein